MRSSVLSVAISILLTSLAAGQATSLVAASRHGQVFITWKESSSTVTGYRVYRSATPINLPHDLANATCLGEVGLDSSLNPRLTSFALAPVHHRIEDLGEELDDDVGLFVHTSSVAGSAWYAVTTVKNGVEERGVTVGQNSLSTPVIELPATPRPVLQYQLFRYWNYTRWVSDHDTPFAPAMWSRPSQHFNMMIYCDASSAVSGQRPLVCRLHSRHGNFVINGPTHAERHAIIVSPDDWVPEAPHNTYWFGVNAAFPNTNAYANSPVIDYTARRVMAEIDFGLAEFSGDHDRVYVHGNSMGATGALLMGYGYPDRIAAILGTVPKLDFGCQQNGCWFEPATGASLWGTPQQNPVDLNGIPIYELLDAGTLACMDPTVDLPPMTMASSRQDAILGWQEKPPVYSAIQDARQSATFFWDDGGHSIPHDWDQVMEERRDGLLRHRLHRAFPAFTRLTIDGDPGTGNPLSGDPRGTINGTLDWDPESIQDEGDHHELECRLRDSSGVYGATQTTAYVDWTPRRLRQLAFEAGEHLRFRNYQMPGGELIDDRVVTVGADGLLTVETLRVTTAGNRIRIEKLVIPQEPYLLVTGDLRPGQTIHANIFATPGSDVYLFGGFQPAQIQVPGIIGDLETAPIYYLGQAFVTVSGRVVLSENLATFLPVSFQVRMQALANLPNFEFTNTVELIYIP